MIYTLISSYKDLKFKTTNMLNEYFCLRANLRKVI